MVFNSFSFLIFFIVVFFAYFFVFKKTAKMQNILILLASYFFYGYADWRMLPLLLVATLLFYGLGIAIAKNNSRNEKTASRLTTLSVVLGVGILLYFKYLNFFIGSFAALFNSFGLHTNVSSFNIIMPIGVSFFTFKLISYAVEIHRERIEPSKDFVEFATYIAFFPTILSGPIDRPNKFIPQLQKKREFDYNIAVDGCRQILWGLFTKMVIADNIAKVTDAAWNNIGEQTGAQLLYVALLYPIQMYTDFDGYSNMAIGVGKILNIKITRNFNHPFIGRNIAEYWQRWHISLTSWLTDYVFSPLNIAFREYEKKGIIFAIIINFVLIGLWHGANWTFALFGLYHGLLYVPLIVSGSFMKKKKIKKNAHGLPKQQDFIKMVETYLLVALGLIIFRAENISQVGDYISQMASTSIFSIGSIYGKKLLAFCILILLFDWIQRDKEYVLQIAGSNYFKNVYLRWSLYMCITWSCMYCFFTMDKSEFIYFQF